MRLLPFAWGAPSAALAADDLFGGINSVLGGAPTELQLFSKDVYVGEGKTVKMQLSSPWPIKYDGNGILRAGYEARKDNRCPGEVGFTQIVKNIGAGNIMDLNVKKLVDMIFVDKGPLGEFTPENVKITSAKKVEGVGGSTYRLVGTRFTRVGVSGVEIESRGLLSATIVGGDLWVYLATCRDNTWSESKERIQPSVESFQVVAA